jgi:hypothetical protein
MDEEGAHRRAEGITGEMMSDYHGRLEALDGGICDVISLDQSGTGEECDL